MKKLIGLLTGILILMGCARCISMIDISSEVKDTSYRIVISSDDASDITIYLPYPHYKGKPDMRYLRWLKESFSERQKDFGPERGKKIDLIDTEYGKMLYIYIPELLKEKTSPTGFTINKGGTSGGESRPLKTNPKTMFNDYKLTYEDKIKPEKEWIDPKYETHKIKILNMPIYVQFEGKELNIDITYGTDWYVVPYGSIASLSYRQGSLENFIKLGPDFFTFTQSGWHWMPIKKEQGGGK